MTIAVIPSRIDSKRITEKNLQKVGGKTLLQRAIDFAFENDLIPVVSTESELVKREVGDQCEVVISDLHHDHGNSLRIWEEAWGFRSEVSVLLEPTSPMRTSSDLKRCLNMLSPPYWLVRTVENVKTTEGLKYKFNGSIYVANHKLQYLDDVYDHRHIGAVITDFRINIDTLEDLKLARLLL